MILIDDRTGSKHLDALLSTLGHSTEVTRLGFGDCAFAGNGANGSTVRVGVELKKLPDLLHSFASGRFTNHQLPGLTEHYDSVTLIVEGRYRPTHSGGLEWASEREMRENTTVCEWRDAGYGFRRWSFRELEGRLSTLEIKAGIRVVRTADDNETARFIGALYEWWTSGEYAEHRSHEAAVLKAQMPMLRPPTLKERIACQLPHVGMKSAPMVAGAFANSREMVNAGIDAWMRIPRFGKKVAQDIVTALTEGE